MGADNFSDNDNLRDESVQEIIGYIPSWIIRSGITAITVIFFILIGITWFIKYPDIIHASIVITTDPPPSLIYAKVSGNIRLLEANESAVKRGDVIGYIVNPASVEEVIMLERNLKNLEKELLTIRILKKHTFSSFSHLGMLQADYESFLTNLNEYMIFFELGAEEQQIKQAREQIVHYERLERNLVNQKSLVVQELCLNMKRYAIDSVLFRERVLTAVELNKSELELLQYKSVVENAETSLINNSIAISGLKNTISQLHIEQTKRGNQLSLKLSNSYRTLLSSILKWKESFLLVSPIEGKISYLNVWHNDEFVKSEGQIAAVVPSTDNIIGRAELPLEGSGKVKIGQKLNIRIDNYPSDQFGFLIGEVKSISMVPSNNSFILNISLPQQLTTSYNKTLEFKQQMTGKTEIITEDLRLVERILYSFRDAWARH